MAPCCRPSRRIARQPPIFCLSRAATLRHTTVSGGSVAPTHIFHEHSRPHRVRCFRTGVNTPRERRPWHRRPHRHGDQARTRGPTLQRAVVNSSRDHTRDGRAQRRPPAAGHRPRSRVLAAPGSLRPQAIEDFGTESNAERLARFRQWFRDVLDAHVLEPADDEQVRQGQHYSSDAIRGAYARGLALGNTDLRRSSLPDPDTGDEGTENPTDLIGRDRHQEALATLFLAVYGDVERAANETHTQVTRTLSDALDGVVLGDSTVEDLTTQLTGRIDAVGKQRTATTAHTRIVQATNKAILRRGAEAGVEQVGTAVEATVTGPHEGLPPGVDPEDVEPDEGPEGTWESAGDRGGSAQPALHLAGKFSDFQTSGRAERRRYLSTRDVGAVGCFQDSNEINTMQLLTNTIRANSVRNEEHRGSDHTVADVTAAQPMLLNGGYVSSQTLKNSTVEWEHTPLPIGHPVDAFGNYISARTPEVIENAVVGYFQNVHYDDEADELNGELWVETDRANDLGDWGERVVEILENGEELEVSTAYRGEDGPSGVYDFDADGNPAETYHDEVKTNLRPDHLAVLPDDLGPGKCNCRDHGCGVEPSEGIDDPEANADLPNGAAPTANSVGVTGHTPATDADANAVPGAGYCTNDAADSKSHVFVNMVDDSDDSDDAGTTNDESATHDSEDTNVRPNQTDVNVSMSDVSEGTKMKWSGGDDTRYGEVVSKSGGDLDDDQVMIAVVDPAESGEDKWTDEQVTMKPESDSNDLETIDQFPSSQQNSGDSQSQSQNTQDADDPQNTGDNDLSANILSDPRVPEYTGLITAEASEDEFLWWSINDYIEGWTEATGNEYDGDPNSALSSVPDDARDWIAEKTLLGTAEAETEDNLLMFDVVGPDGNLYEERLEDVTGVIGSRATIPEEQRESARTVARDLLESEFGHSFDGETNANSGGVVGTVRDLVSHIPGLRVTSDTGSTSGAGSAADTTSNHENDDCGCGESSQNDCDCGHEAGGTGGTIPNDNDTTTTTMSDELTDDDYEQIADHPDVNWSPNQLKKMAEDDLTGLHNLVNAAEESDDGTGGDDPDGTDDDDPAGTGDDDDDDVDANEEIPDAVAARFDDLEETINEQQDTIEAQEETIEEYRNSRNEAEQTRRDDAKETIRANTNAYTDDQLEDMDTPALESTARMAQQSGNSGTDFGGVGLSRPHGTIPNSDDGADTGTKSGGSFADYVNAEDDDGETAD